MIREHIVIDTRHGGPTIVVRQIATIGVLVILITT